MKRKLCLLMSGIGLSIFLLSGIISLAEEKQTKSHGNIEGVINFYSDDIKYLENEIYKLLAECEE